MPQVKNNINDIITIKNAGIINLEEKKRKNNMIDWWSFWLKRL